MTTNTALLAAFATSKSARLQRTNPVNPKIIREFNPLLDNNGLPFLTSAEWAEIRKNRENYISLIKSISGAIAKKAHQKQGSGLSESEINGFLDYLHSIACSADFPFYGNRLNGFFYRNAQLTRNLSATLFMQSDPYLVREFLGNFSAELGALLQKSSSFAYLDGQQVSHLQFHAVYALCKLFGDYLTHCKQVALQEQLLESVPQG